jgi:cation:H+ antiporter
LNTVFVGLGWILGLATALYASEKLVHYLSQLGTEVRIPIGLLGLVVAFGADAPEVTSALIAAARGSTDVGLGVILGSNIYNLAGLLGFSALIAHRITTTPYRLVVDGGTNVLLTLGLVALIFVPAMHVALGAALLLILLGYVAVVSVSRERVLRGIPSALHNMLHEGEVSQHHPRTEPVPHVAITIGFVALSTVFIVVGSDVLVNTSITLGSTIGLPSSVIGTFVLAVATSLPNTWAAITLARRGLGGAAVVTTFSSNSINAALGAGLPSLVVPLHVSATSRAISAPWLLGMTAMAIALLATRWSLTYREGVLLLLGYGAFVAIFLVSLR